MINFLFKMPGHLLKILEKSWNFVSPKKWEPCVGVTRRHLNLYYIADRRSKNDGSL